MRADDEKLAIGLMSGTSLDGIDAALVRISGQGTSTRVELVTFITLPFGDAVRGKLQTMVRGEDGGSREVCLMNVLLGRLSLEACRQVCARAGVDVTAVAFVGSHGQTIYHEPMAVDFAGHQVRGTLQIGDASIIAEGMGCPVVSNFRSRDMAAGGQGAPLVPYSEFIMYRSPDTDIALQNIGGIGNITFIPRGGAMDSVMAFDTGPGNMVIDALVGLLSHGRLSYDKDGAIAAASRTDPSLLAWMMDDPYLTRPLPKSTGREMYGQDYVARLVAFCAERNISLGDAVATATYFTAACIEAGIRSFCPAVPGRLVVGGGGSHNLTLLGHLKTLLPRTQVMTNEDMGLDSDAKEAVAFAILANETLLGNPSNVPGATGAAHPVVLGHITP